MPDVPASLRIIAGRVEARLRVLLDAERTRWATLDAELAAPLDALAALVLNGGKRLRPAFCHWAWVAAGGEPEASAAVDAGAAFELLQAFALMHDDVMDGSSTRRGVRTTHLAFEDRHRAAAWRGEARRFGEGMAILVGDLSFVYADQLLRGASPGALAVWDELRIELNIGQFLDLAGTARGDRSMEAAERIVRYKSAKYTVERPLHLGVALASDDHHELADQLSGYGLPLGDAFQLRDDVLGAFGDAATIGKPVGDDLREGKPTPLLAIATARASSAQRRTLDRVGALDLAPDEVGAIQQVLEATGARQEVEAVIQELTDKAVVALEAIPMPGDAREALGELARFVAWRDR